MLFKILFEISEDELKQEITAKVTEMIGPIAKPDKILIVDGLPKTRSGKIMRRILRKIAAAEVAGVGAADTWRAPRPCCRTTGI